jgi:hypothetical protein
MLEDANIWLNQSNREIRKQLTAEYVLFVTILNPVANPFHRTRANYREIQNYPKYARVVRRMLLGLVRWKDQLEGDIRLPMPRTPRQELAITALHDFVFATNPFCATDESRYDESLDKVLHEMLEALYHHELRHEHFIACILDVLMILLSLNEDGSICKGSQITHLCAIQQYQARSTTVHSLRLFSMGEKKYVPMSTVGPNSGDGIIEDGDDSFVTCVNSIL